MKKEESIFWFACKVIGFLVFIFLVLVVPYQIGKTHTESDSLEVGIPIPTELCEYNERDFYFKGNCNDVHQLVEYKMEKTGFDEYMETTTNEFENNCIEFVAERLYTNLKKNEFTYEDFENVSFEEFKEEEDVQTFLNMSCTI